MLRTIRGWLGDFRRDRSGAVALTFALSAAPLMLAIGFAIEYSNTQLAAAKLQAAIDEAVLTASMAPAANRNTVADNMINAVLAGANLTLNSITHSPATPATADTSYSVTVNAVAPTYLLSNLMANATITRSATASLVISGASSTTNVTKTIGSITTPTYTGCFLTLDPHAALSFDVISASQFNTGGCSAYVSTDATTIWIAGLAAYQDNSKVVAGTGTTWATNSGQKVCILLKEPYTQGLTLNSGVTINAPNCEIDVASAGTGGSALTSNSPALTLAELCVNGTNNTINGVSPASLKTGCAPATDSFAGTLPVVTVGGCTVSNQNYAGNQSLSPGTYCGNFNFNGSGTLSLSPGLYVFSNTRWTLNSGWTVNGTGVTFYFADSNSYIQFNSGTTINLAAPTSGAYANILMYEPTGLSNSSFAIDGSNHAWSGLIYLPSRNVTFNSMITTSVETVSIVFNSLTINSGNTWNVDASPKSLTSSNNTKATVGNKYYGAWYDSASSVSFAKVCSHASYNLNVVNVTNNCAAINDPFSTSLPAVTPDASCANSNHGSSSSPVSIGVNMPPSGRVTLCGYVTLSGGLQPGLYIIQTPSDLSGAKLNLSDATGSGVTFYVADANATIGISGNPGLKAPTSGLYEGILVFMPSTFTTKQNVTFGSLSCDNGHNTANSPAFSGLFYTPSWNLTLHSWSSCTVSGTWVANAIAVDSFSNVTLTPSARTIYVDSLGFADYSYKTTQSTTVANGATSIYLSR